MLQGGIPDESLYETCMVQTRWWQQAQLSHGENDSRPWLAYMRVLRNLDPNLILRFRDWVTECLDQPQLIDYCPALSRILHCMVTSWWSLDHDAGLKVWHSAYLTQHPTQQWFDSEPPETSTLLQRRSARIASNMSSGRASRSSSAALPRPSPPMAASRNQSQDLANASNLPLPPVNMCSDSDMFNMLPSLHFDQGDRTGFETSNEHLGMLQGQLVPGLAYQQHQQHLLPQLVQQPQGHHDSAQVQQHLGAQYVNAQPWLESQPQAWQETQLVLAEHMGEPSRRFAQGDQQLNVSLVPASLVSMAANLGILTHAILLFSLEYILLQHVSHYSLNLASLCRAAFS